MHHSTPRQAFYPNTFSYTINFLSLPFLHCPLSLLLPLTHIQSFISLSLSLSPGLSPDAPSLSPLTRDKPCPCTPFDPMRGEGGRRPLSPTKA